MEGKMRRRGKLELMSRPTDFNYDINNGSMHRGDRKEEDEDWLTTIPLTRTLYGKKFSPSPSSYYDRKWMDKSSPFSPPFLCWWSEYTLVQLLSVLSSSHFVSISCLCSFSPWWCYTRQPQMHTHVCISQTDTAHCPLTNTAADDGRTCPLPSFFFLSLNIIVSLSVQLCMFLMSILTIHLRCQIDRKKMFIDLSQLDYFPAFFARCQWWNNSTRIEVFFSLIREKKFSNSFAFISLSWLSLSLVLVCIHRFTRKHIHTLPFPSTHLITMRGERILPRGISTLRTFLSFSPELFTEDDDTRIPGYAVCDAFLLSASHERGWSWDGENEKRGQDRVKYL